MYRSVGNDCASGRLYQGDGVCCSLDLCPRLVPADVTFVVIFAQAQTSRRVDAGVNAVAT